ncbi:MAG: efflux RND transporter periplasmic adaptor subunit [Saprospiraceae bacterium]
MTIQKSLFYALSSIVLIMACSGKPKNQNPNEELITLREDAKKINDRIKELENLISLTDTTMVSKSRKAKKVVLDTLKPQLFMHYIEAQGFVDADLNVLAAPQMPGVIKSILVKEGDRVTTGQILAKLDASTVLQGIEEVKTGLSMANTMYDKQKSLWEQNIGSEAQYLQAKNQKEQLEKKILTLNAQYALSNIKSPINGSVDEIKIKIGEMASPGMNGVRVVNNSKLKVKAKLSDMFSNKVKKGDKVLIYFPDLDKEINSTISFTSQSVNLNSRTIMVESNLAYNKDYKANQTAKVKINDSNIKNALVVNSNLIQKSVDGDDYLLVAIEKNGQLYARKKIITVGINYSGFTVIEKGVSIGEAIISTGYNELVDGQMIQL